MRATGSTAQGDWLRGALLVAATLAAAPLGYVATFVLLGLMALAGLAFARLRDVPPAGAGLSAGLSFAALILIVIATAGTLASPADLLLLLGFSALLFHAAAAWLGARGAAPGNANRFADYALGGAAIGLATALVYRFGLGFERAAEGAPFDDPTRLATTSVLLGFLALMGLRGETRRRWIYLLGPVFGTATALLCGSRDALVAIPVLLVLAAFMLPARRRLAIGGGAILATVAIGAVLLLVPVPGTARSSLADIVGAIGSGDAVDDPAVAVRLRLYGLGWQAFLDAPMAGHGLAHVMDEVHPGIAADEQAYGAVPHLHDDALQFAVAAGLPGIAAFLLLLAAPLAAILRSPPDGQSRARNYGLAVLAAGYLVMGIFDTMLASPLSLTLFVVLMALLSGGCRDAA